MFAIQQHGSRLCDGLTRREWLKIGSLGLMGLSRPRLLSRPALASPLVRDGFGKAKACILLFLLGGPPQHETWDPKPDAPPEIRGELKPISSSVPMPNLAPFTLPTRPPGTGAAGTWPLPRTFVGAVSDCSSSAADSR